MKSVRILLPIFFLVIIQVASGLKCYKCGYIKNLDSFPITLPGLTVTKDCKEGELSSDLLKQCPSGSVCGKVKGTAEGDVEAYLKGCVPNTSVTDCEDLTVKESLKIIEALIGQTIELPPGSEPAFSIRACVCDTEGCNAATAAAPTSILAVLSAAALFWAKTVQYS